MEIGIIGGGISGISLALKVGLLKEKNKDINITLLEASNSVGGTIKSVQKDGYTIEAGTNGFLDSKPFTLEVFEEAGLSNKLVQSNDNARKRFIQRYNKLQRMPENAAMFLSSNLLTLKGKIRIAGELFVPKKDNNNDETLASFAKRRLGEEALDFLIGPMVSGIFAGDPEKMSLKSSFPVISDLEQNYGGLIKGMLKKRNKKSGPAGPGGVLTSYEGGMGEAVKDLANKCIEKGVNIYLNSPVIKVTKNENKYLVETKDNTYTFDILAIACPAYEGSTFLSELHPELSETLKEIPYSPIFVAGLGFNNEDMEDAIDGFGYLIPAKENRRILGALFTSSMFPDQAPKGKKFLRVLSGGDKNRELLNKSDEELLKISIDDITDILKIKNQPYMIQTFRYEKAIPQYYIGHEEKVKKIENITSKLGNLFIGGNILYGIGLNDCTKRSKEIAKQIEKLI